tara:strand:- start:14922 stop:15413 length:492 start_codon:yes stop_codon:yes gene_type:complete
MPVSCLDRRSLLQDWHGFCSRGAAVAIADSARRGARSNWLQRRLLVRAEAGCHGAAVALVLLLSRDDPVRLGARRGARLVNGQGLLNKQPPHMVHCLKGLRRGPVAIRHAVPPAPEVAHRPLLPAKLSAAPSPISLSVAQSASPASDRPVAPASPSVQLLLAG